jgi:hypothetical protein
MQIQRMQTSEEHLEARKQEKIVQGNKFDKLIKDLEHNQETMDTKILNSEKDRQALSGANEDNSVESLNVDLEA